MPALASHRKSRLAVRHAWHKQRHQLGLSICKNAVENPAGKISARSGAGHGAVFCFTLPLAKWKRDS
jgi:signal transduction histidine kinase